MSDAGIGTKIFMTLFRPVQRLPLGFHYFWGSVFSFIAGKLLHYRRDVIIANLSRSFPDMKYGKVRSLADDFYRHMGNIFAEAIWFGGNHGRPGRAHRQGICTVSDISEMNADIEAGRSVMVLDSHFGNWEIIGGFFEYLDDAAAASSKITPESIVVVYKQLRSRFWDAFMKANRCAAMKPDFEGYVESMKVFRHAFEHRGEPHVYIFPTDQYPYYGAKGCRIPSFMNQPTMVMTGGAALAKRFGMSVYYMGMPRLEKGRYAMTFTRVCEDASALEPAEIMEKYYALLQEDIQRQPDNYLWSHRRWK